MGLTTPAALSTPLKLPIKVRRVGDLPKIMAGGIPVIPINVALQRRQSDTGATRASLDTYVRAGRLYCEFAAHRGQSLIGITNEEFSWFKNALQGSPFPNAAGAHVKLSGERGRRTTDLMLTLIYSIAADIEEIYEVSFDWRRYRHIPNELISVIRSSRGFSHTRSFPRVHKVSWTAPKVMGLPDEQFRKLLRAAHARWGNQIPEGDAAFAKNPESQRGALFYRNAAILSVLRYAGGRRSEVTPIELNDIDALKGLLYLVTKGHGNERLPVLLFPALNDITSLYVERFRPSEDRIPIGDRALVFLSHSLRNYGGRLTAQSVRAIIDALRPALDSPWDEIVTPHTLRHAFAYELQTYGGPAAVTTNMRHASVISSDAYVAELESIADELLMPANENLERMFEQAGVSGGEEE
jgi:integrase